MKVKYERNFGRFDRYFQKNMAERYIEKTNSIYAEGKYFFAEQICYAEFSRYYPLIRLI